MTIEDRKDQHIRANLHDDVAYRELATGFDSIHFQHNAMPNLDLDQIDTKSTVLGWELDLPILVSSMIGGTEEAFRILTNLAEAAAEVGCAIGLGSQRIAIEQPVRRKFFEIRQIAANVPLLANLGAIQLRKGITVSDCQNLVECSQADALILHFNPLQEALQSGGDTTFAGLEPLIEQVVRAIDVPVIAKEVGFGISGDVAGRLANLGVRAIDVAGAGGTSWSAVEGRLADDPIKRELAGVFREWGIPTVESLRQVSSAVPDLPVFCSGGVRNGLDAAKAIRLGASLVGFAGAALRAAADGPEGGVEFLTTVREALRITMFATGSADFNALRTAPLLD